MEERNREKLREEVWSQIKVYMENVNESDDKDTMYCFFFNNFILNFPCPPTRRTSLQNVLDDPRFNRDNGQSLRQFYMDIDSAIESCGIDIPLMAKLAHEGVNEMSKRKELYELMLPVYVELLARGYTRGDLVR